VGAQLIAAALGAVFSYDFGMRISGLPLALLLAANGAFFGTIMVGYVADLAKLARDRLEQGSPRS
jgi:MFS-type transporter involved in bile tolerance (Atg22 family)